MEPKGSLRKAALATRRAMADAEVTKNSAIIAAAVLALPEFLAATHVYTYISAGNEVDTASIIREAFKQGKHVYAPRTDGPALRWGRLKTLDGLLPGRFGVLEPPLDAPLPAQTMPSDVCLVPGVLFTPEGHRLGQGGGHYDRFLAAFPGLRIGLAHDWQLVASLPFEPHDIPMQIIQTEQRALRTAWAR